MQFDNPLEQAFLLRRYKRFLADVYHPSWPHYSNSEHPLTVHCPNTGAMTGCAEPGMRVWLSDSQNSKRKYRYTWELAETSAGDSICVNTQRANQVVGEALQQQLLPAFRDINEWCAERRYGDDNRRIDWQGTTADGRQCYVEVKSVTLAEGAQGYFPDTVSQRARDHLRNLQAMVAQGQRAAVIYCVLHSGVQVVSAAPHCDPKYAEAAIEAKRQGVEFYALACDISPQGIHPKGELPVK